MEDDDDENDDNDNDNVDHDRGDADMSVVLNDGLVTNANTRDDDPSLKHILYQPISAVIKSEGGA